MESVKIELVVCKAVAAVNVGITSILVLLFDGGLIVEVDIGSSFSSLNAVVGGWVVEVHHQINLVVADVFDWSVIGNGDSVICDFVDVHHQTNLVDPSFSDVRELCVDRVLVVVSKYFCVSNNDVVGTLSIFSLLLSVAVVVGVAVVEVHHQTNLVVGCVVLVFTGRSCLAVVLAVHHQTKRVDGLVSNPIS